MAVTDRSPFPLLLKIVFPPLFLLDFLRHFIHCRMIVHVGPTYTKANKSVLMPFLDEIRQYLDDFVKKNNKAPTVLEFGSGPFPTLDILPPGTHLIAVEPCSDFNSFLNEAWNKSSLASDSKFTLVNAMIEELDSKVADGSVDVVLSRLVNCSVSDNAATFRQIHRVLKKDGRYFFWDHVRSDNFILQMIQRLLTFPVFTYFTDCNPARRPYELLKGAGFTDVKVNRFIAPMKGLLFKVFTPTAAGYAVK